MGRGLKFANAPSDSVPRQSRGFGHGAHATPSQRNRLDGRPPATRTFVEFRVKGFELRSNPFDDQSILHAPLMTQKLKTIKPNCSSYFRTAPKPKERPLRLILPTSSSATNTCWVAWSDKGAKALITKASYSHLRPSQYTRPSCRPSVPRHSCKAVFVAETTDADTISALRIEAAGNGVCLWTLIVPILD